MFVAEDVPWYMVDSSTERPWRDEDLGMSAPQILGRFDTEDEARAHIASKIEEYGGYGFNQSGRSKYMAAALFMLNGGEGVRIYGRYYRVREV